ncbi:probable WRKY transcription factor 12 [Cryptomeria japonica]|uniref:probable WRKY transcription factor 12 n=1 Tax=Cryptomeria japonica TaxID=3369 RepID=UPI0027DA6F98|nr:probable WRKY transcription factor 12 [Cryptomeria japonica]
MESLPNGNTINPIPMQTMFMQQQQQHNQHQQQGLPFNESVQFEPHDFMPRNTFTHSDLLNQGNHAYDHAHGQCSSSSFISPTSAYIHANFAGSCSRSIMPDMTPPQASQSFEDDFHSTAPNTTADANTDPKNVQSVWSSPGKVKPKTRRKLREPRFCFQTRSDVDVLDDGYKWRKYGQKIVKNSLHPSAKDRKHLIQITFALYLQK